jgi:hypothetical protein
MKEYSKQSIDRLAYACLALAVIAVAFYLIIISTRAPARPYILGVAVMFVIFSSTLILRTRASKRTLNVGLAISASVFLVALIGTVLHDASSAVMYVSAISAVVVCIFLVSSSSFHSKNVTLSKSNAEMTVRIVLSLIAIFVVIYFGILQGRFFSDYLWVALAIVVLATLARKRILRTTAPKKD